MRNCRAIACFSQSNDLHAIPQRIRNRRQRIGCRDEEDVRQVVVDLEVVIAERPVLLGVEHFEQSGRGIAAIILPQFVDLVEQDHGVYDFGAAHCLDHAAGHGTDVRAPVTADLRLVAHAA